MIPKICHLIWTEGVPMSWLQTLTVRSFRKHNPDWHIIVHLITNKLPPNKFTKDYTGKDYFDTLNVRIRRVNLLDEGIGEDRHGILASDLLRTKLLHRIGGVYSDFDMLWLRSMDQFITDFETTMCWYGGTGQHWNQSNIVSEPGGKFLADFIAAQTAIKPPYNHQSFLTELLNRTFPSPETIVQKYPKVVIIPYEWFYPYSIYDLAKLYHDDVNLARGSFGIHWFNGHDLSQEYIRNMQPCSMTTILRNEGYYSDNGCL